MAHIALLVAVDLRAGLPSCEHTEVRAWACPARIALTLWLRERSGVVGCVGAIRGPCLRWERGSHAQHERWLRSLVSSTLQATGDDRRQPGVV